MGAVAQFMSTPATPKEEADGHESKATFIAAETAITFTLANTGGVAVLTVIGLLGYALTPQVVVITAVALGLVVIALGGNWETPKTKGGKWGPVIQRGASRVVLGALNIALLAVALWGSITAIQAGLV